MGVGRRVRSWPAVPLVVLTLAAGACAGDPPGDGAPGPATSTAGAPGTGRPGPTDAPGPGPTPEPSSAAGTATATAAPGVLVTGLESPWGLDFLPDGDALVTERDTGRVLRVSPGGSVAELGTVPGVRHGGEGGLLGIAVAPDVERSGDVFVYATTDRDNRVLRMRLTDGRLEGASVILDGVPSAGNHNGGRLAFGPDGYLYVTTGDAGNPGRAQDLDSLGGKILRVDTSGRPAPGNPFDGSPVWSYGHRNVQGIAWDSAGRMYASEFGQNTFDELNRIEPGANYGWPEVEGAAGASPDGDDGAAGVEGFVDPLRQWSTDQASPSGIAVVDDVVYLAALRGESLWRVPLADGAAGEPVRLLEGEYGRLRAVEPDAAGNLWLLTSNRSRGEPVPEDDRIVVVDPAGLG